MGNLCCSGEKNNLNKNHHGSYIKISCLIKFIEDEKKKEIPSTIKIINNEKKKIDINYFKSIGIL